MNTHDRRDISHVQKAHGSISQHQLTLTLSRSAAWAGARRKRPNVTDVLTVPYLSPPGREHLDAAWALLVQGQPAGLILSPPEVEALVRAPNEKRLALAASLPVFTCELQNCARR